MINICYGITSYIIIVIGLLSVLSVYPQRRWKSHIVYIIFYILIAGGIAWEAQDSTRGFVTDLQMIFNPIITLLLLKIFYKIFQATQTKIIDSSPDIYGEELLLFKLK